MIGILLFIIILVYVLYVRWKRRTDYAIHEVLKNDTWCLPILGNWLEFYGSDEARMNALQRFARIAIKQGGLTSLWLGHKYYVVVADPKVADVVLKTIVKKDDVLDIVRELLGNSSIFAPVEIWRPRRKAIAPTFSMKNLNQFVEVFSRQSSVMVKKLNDVSGKGTFSLWNYLTTYTMDSVCESTLGVNIGAQHNPDQPFLEAFEQHCHMASSRLLQPPVMQKAYTYFPIHKVYMKHIYRMWEFVDSIVSKKRKQLEENNETQQQSNNVIQEKPILKTFLELYIESSGGSSGFTDVELREETLLLVLAGTDTSAVGSCFTALLLARHTDVQEKVYHEIKEVLGDINKPITAADLPNLKYLEAVIKESLRLYPPVPVTVRKADKDFQLPSGLTMVKDTAMLVNFWGVHRNPEYWGDDADEFRPERFLGSSPIHPAAFIPFSYGPRSCLGYQYAMMSMKTAVASIIRHYRLLPATPVQDKNEPLRVKFGIMMKHSENFELKIEART